MAKSKKLVRITLALPDGTRKYFSGATRKEAERKRDEAKIKLGFGIDIGNDMTFRELAEIWEEDYSSRPNLHPKTVECAKNIMKQHVLPAFGEMKLRDIKPIHVDMMLRKMSGLSKSTQRKALIYAGAVFNKAIENDIIPKSPTFNKKPTAKEPEKVPALTDEQCRILLNAVKDTRVYPFIVVLLFCGLRKGEALGLMWKDIDFQNKLNNFLNVSSVKEVLLGVIVCGSSYDYEVCIFVGGLAIKCSHQVEVFLCQVLLDVFVLNR